jgi:hypothetical protein
LHCCSASSPLDFSLQVCVFALPPFVAFHCAALHLSLPPLLLLPACSRFWSCLFRFTMVSASCVFLSSRASVTVVLPALSFANAGSPPAVGTCSLFLLLPTHSASFPPLSAWLLLSSSR